MQVPISHRVQAATIGGVSLLLLVVFAQANVGDTVVFVQSVITDFIEPTFGLNKEMLEGQ